MRGRDSCHFCKAQWQLSLLGQIAGKPLRAISSCSSANECSVNIQGVQVSKLDQRYWCNGRLSSCAFSTASCNCCAKQTSTFCKSSASSISPFMDHVGTHRQMHPSLDMLQMLSSSLTAAIDQTVQKQMIKQGRPAMSAKLAKHHSIFELDEQEDWVCCCH